MSSYFCTVTIIVKVDRKGCGKEGERRAKGNGGAQRTWEGAGIIEVGGDSR